ncbi:ATP-binding protein [Azospirillum sp. TSO22-1]|uniref:ATP-binding protein n=1 Tax=Azospirillum sp. TSO22-1 TaxID=716789 RepID=UPI000D60F221|nr:ATP-binding protein [Azospirillum sp. TSO22-1]PWC44838.1 alkaline phosphatase [Azospirillum sp. TSO22-1]
MTPPLPLRSRLAATLALLPAAVWLAAAALTDQPLLPLGLVALLAAVAGVGLLLRQHRRDLTVLADSVAQGAEDEEELASPAAHELATAISSLRRTLSDDAAEAQAQLEADEAILEALHDPLVLIDAERQVARANAAARALFGDKVAGRDLAASVRNPTVLEAVDAVLAGGASRIVEFAQPVPVERTFEVRVTPFQRRAPGSPRMAILTLHDITTIRRTEQMRADFIANASHELRTPLSSLLGFIETLRGPARDDLEAHERFLGIMHDQASRMSRLVNDLLSLSRIELDEHMPPAGQVDVPACIQGVLDSLELKAAARRIALRLETPDGLPAAVGDEDQLTQVFSNLISNAVKYTRPDTEITVTIALSDTAAAGPAPAAPARRAPPGRSLAVAVIDRGEGIPRQHLPRLTERFYRVDAARSRAMGGTGLGLAIVKHIVNRHRGRLTIDSEVGTGTTFTVYLPVAAPVGVAAAQPAKQRRAGDAA